MARRKAPNAQSKPDRHLIERNGITPYLKAFMDWSAMTGYTEQTIRTRKIAVGYFIRWCDERGLNSPQEITTPILERYRRHLYYTRKANGEPLMLSIEEIDTIFNQALIHGDLGLRDRAIKKHILAAGIDKPGACHIFRHSMATHMLDTGEGNGNAEGGQRKKQGQRH